MHSENPTKIQICLAPVTNKAQNMLIMSVNQRLNFGFGRMYENQIQDFVSVNLISWRKYKNCIFHTGIGIFGVYYTLSYEVILRILRMIS